jgi:hypothetical protein
MNPTPFAQAGSCGGIGFEKLNHSPTPRSD